MPDFNELITQLRTPSDDSPPPTIFDDLTAEYAALRDGANARVNEANSEAERLRAENAALKARNYDLLVSVSATGTSGDDDKSNTDDDNKPASLADLFVKRGK